MYLIDYFVLLNDVMCTFDKEIQTHMSNILKKFAPQSTLDLNYNNYENKFTPFSITYFSIINDEFLFFRF